MVTKVLALSGSLRAESKTTAVLQALPLLGAPGFEFTAFKGLDGLPFFNPDLDEQAPPPVMAFRAALRATDAVVICSPEYAHGVAGVLKNALDWLVGSGELVDKLVLVINASPLSTFAHPALLETLAVMSARLAPPRGVVLPHAPKTTNPNAIVSDAALSERLRDGLAHLGHR